MKLRKNKQLFMRVPIRKGSGPLAPSQDPKMTQEKYEELKKKLDFWLKIKRPREAEEVKRLALMGDFSENVGYQIAKGRLRSLNQRIIELEKLLGRVEIIENPTNSETVVVGSEVIIESSAKQKKYKILGSSESNPSEGIISHVSPLGSALLGKRVGEEFEFGTNGKKKVYKIIEIK